MSQVGRPQCVPHVVPSGLSDSIADTRYDEAGSDSDTSDRLIHTPPPGSDGLGTVRKAAEDPDDLFLM